MGMGESQNSGRVWVGKGLKAPPVPWTGQGWIQDGKKMELGWGKSWIWDGEKSGFRMGKNLDLGWRKAFFPPKI